MESLTFWPRPSCYSTLVDRAKYRGAKRRFPVPAFPHRLHQRGEGSPHFLIDEVIGGDDAQHVEIVQCKLPQGFARLRSKPRNRFGNRLGLHVRLIPPAPSRANESTQGDRKSTRLNSSH